MAYRKRQEFQLINKYHFQSFLDLYYTKQKTKKTKTKTKNHDLKNLCKFHTGKNHQILLSGKDESRLMEKCYF